MFVDSRDNKLLKLPCCRTPAIRRFVPETDCGVRSGLHDLENFGDQIVIKAVLVRASPLRWSAKNMKSVLLGPPS